MSDLHFALQDAGDALYDAHGLSYGEQARVAVRAWLDSLGLKAFTLDWQAEQFEASGYQAATELIRFWAEAIRAVQE